MRKEQYVKIKEYLGKEIRGSEFEGHVVTVGGCIRDELMGLDIKDIDLCVSLPEGGIRLARRLEGNNLTTHKVTVYPSYGTAMLHLKAFPEVELELVQTRKEKYTDQTCRDPQAVFGIIEREFINTPITR